ncbi:hypothetical protein [Victivallis lenta]|uniref:hypothetical protein n=1 Tax=Victivallis lenta TaxID=2606640 RepID=UPI003AB784BA
MKISALHLAALFAALSAAASTPDRFGQYAGETWPGKVSDEAELKADYVREQKELAGVTRDEANSDRFGGRRNSGLTFKATGFFRVEKSGGRWWLVTPEGNPFYLRGVGAVPYSEWGYYAPVFEKDGSPRACFAGVLPDRNEFPEAYRNNNTRVNFHAANLKRKLGPDFHEKWLELTEKRLLAWGFNASAKWNDPFVFDRLPFIFDATLTARRIAGRFIDPYDPSFRENAERQIRELAGRLAANPMLIAWQFENENGWGQGIPYQILRDASGTLAAKRALIDFLREGSEDAGALFGLPGTPVEQLMKTALFDLRRLPAGSLNAFIRAASGRYHAVLRELLGKYDPNHLFLGASHCNGQSLEWIEGALEHIDILPLHEYDLNSRWIGGVLAERISAWDKPFAVLEFSFTCHRRGFGAYHSCTIVADDRSRGEAFRMYTENLAAHPCCVGSSYFILHDQPIAGRGLDGEAFNFGLLDVTDRPYAEMLPAVREANARLFDIHAGRRQPVPVTDILTPMKRYAAFRQESIHTGIVYDKSNSHFFPTREGRMTFANAPFGVPLPVGVVDAGRPGGFRKVEFLVHLWKNERDQNPANWFRLEESADGQTFRPTEAAFEKVWENVFPGYRMRPVRLRPDTRYVRPLFILKDPAAPWATSLAEATAERN